MLTVQFTNTPFTIILHCSIGVKLRYKYVRIARKLYEHLVLQVYYTTGIMLQTRIYTPFLHKQIILQIT